MCVCVCVCVCVCACACYKMQPERSRNDEEITTKRDRTTIMARSNASSEHKLTEYSLVEIQEIPGIGRTSQNTNAHQCTPMHTNAVLCPEDCLCEQTTFIPQFPCDFALSNKKKRRY